MPDASAAGAPSLHFPETMSKTTFESAVADIVKRDPRFATQGYDFLQEALKHAMEHLRRGRRKEVQHVSGRELCLGLREYALKQFGPMVPVILEDWGIRTTRDIGEMVFNLIETGIFSRSKTDKVEDFDNVFDFTEAFVQPYLPARSVKPAPQSKASRG